MWISCGLVPLAWITQIELSTSGVTWREKMISFPGGDQSPV
jgi:hypothetical protein